MSKSVLITGTSQGIGHALTKLLLINGYRVIGTNTTGIDNINDNNYNSFSLDLSNLDSITAFEKNLQIEKYKN
jgi:NAD(P)-dependent dehydrogenase (short-subunit alcohol dehydrogenase family)